MGQGKKKRREIFRAVSLRWSWRELTLASLIFIKALTIS